MMELAQSCPKCCCTFLFTMLIAFLVGVTRPDVLEEMSNDRKYYSIAPRNNCGIEDDPEVAENGALISGPQQQLVDWAYSPVDLMQLAKFEYDLYDQFGSQSVKQKFYYESMQKDNDLEEFYKWWVQDYEETSLKATQHLPEFKRIGSIFTHPFLTLRMMQRFRRLTELLKERTDIQPDPAHADIHDIPNSGLADILKSTPDFFRMVKTFDARIKLPVYRDLKNVIKSIITMQSLYDLDIDQLILGKFGDISTSFGLRLEEAFDLGNWASRIHMFPEALDWLQTVYSEVNRNVTPTTLSNTTVLGLILDVSKEHDSLIDKFTVDRRYDNYHRFTDKITSKNPLKTIKSVHRDEFLRTKNAWIGNYLPAYSMLCAGRDFIPEALRAKLVCWYEHKSDLAWVINPLKMEVYSWDPYIVQMYDVIGDNLTDFLLSTAMPNMERALTAHTKDGTAKGYATMFRTSTSTPIFENHKIDGPILQSLDRRVGQITGLAVANPNDPFKMASEEWQISSYAFGGEFAPHVDALDDSNLDGKAVGDRIATFMVYLNNVQRGGYTVFPDIGVSVVPRKGSALFWYDLYRNGTTDKRTLHGGCPVILGQKWIGTKWIRYGASFRKRPCTLNAYE